MSVHLVSLSLIRFKCPLFIIASYTLSYSPSPLTLSHSFPPATPSLSAGPSLRKKPLWSLSGRSQIHPIQMAVKLGWK